MHICHIRMRHIFKFYIVPLRLRQPEWHTRHRAVGAAAATAAVPVNLATHFRVKLQQRCVGSHCKASKSLPGPSHAESPGPSR